jgi:large subunit ribosomal protein L7/L12
MADLNHLVDELSKLTILEASELKTLLEDKWGVKAAAGGGMMMMGAMPAAAAAAAEPVEEPTEFNVLLKTVGDKKIDVIKVVRALTSLGLKEAKDLVESAAAAPAVVLEAVNKDRSEDAKKQFAEVGATIEIKPV